MSEHGPVLFLHGADMAPEAIMGTWRSARFIARAKVSAWGLPAPVPSPADVAAVWGILVSVHDVDAPASGPAVAATADDGRSFTATPVTQPEALADPAATVAAARYWELPPAYVAALAALATGAPVPVA